MSQSFTNTTEVSWFQRIKSALIGIPIGILLALISIVLLWWNEGRAVQTQRSLTEGQGLVVSLDDGQVVAGNDGKLVHLTGEATTAEEITDPEFGIRDKAIRLTRDVEMYQWVEHESTKTEKKVGGGEKKVTEYTYEKAWRTDVIQSANFQQPKGHANPSAMPYKSEAQYAQRVTIGAFRLTKDQASRINNSTPIAMDESRLATLPPEIKAKVSVRSGQLYLPAMPQRLPNAATGEPAAEADPAQATVAESNGTPSVGDVRVSFSAVYPTQISLIARQIGDSFEPYPTSAGDRLDMLQLGAHSAESMFSDAQAANRTMTWICRAIGFVLMLVGFGMMLGPLSVLADVVPVFGSVTRSIAGVIAFAMATPVSLIIIGMAWLFYRPLLGVSLLLAAAVAVAVAIWLWRSRKQPADGSPAAAEEIIDVG